MNSAARAKFLARPHDSRALTASALFCLTLLAQAPVPGQTSAAEIRSQSTPASAVSLNPAAQGSATLELPLSSAQTGTAGDSLLELPSRWNPAPEKPLGSPPPALADVTIPDPFIGCWKGTPSDWDETHVFRGFVIGSPGEIEFCYGKKQIDVPEAEVAVTGMRRALEVALNLGLAYSTFAAHGVHTDVFGVSQTKIHGETTLTIEHKMHLLHLLPVDAPDQRSLVEWSGAIVPPGELTMHARQVIYWRNVPLFAAAWHCNFHRVAASAAPE